MKKKLAFILAFVILSVSIFSVPVMANNGTWRYDSSNGCYYYWENSARQSGWIQHNGKWYYCNTSYPNYRYDDTVACINQKWYYFDADGVMATGWQYLATSDGSYGWFYFSSSGARQKGWIQDNGKWYLLNDYGYMLTGWQSVGGKWYYLKENGSMVTGWYKINGYWYYFNSSGAQQTGWVKVGNAWYYLNEAMYYGGVATIGGKKYCFANSGKMLTGWQKCETTSGTIEWFYFDSNGAMHTGWLKSGGYWYYLDESMVHSGYRYINGKKYIFADNGICTNP